MGLFSFFSKKRTPSGHTPTGRAADISLSRAPRRIRPEEHGIDRNAISRNALRVVRTLQQNGHVAYLVGGCVRDLLIGRKPKDFDVVTDATPQRIKDIFRFARIIGRRFRIVHIPFGTEIIETATFRALPPPGGSDEMLVRDNVYGSEREDAVRRDITINALFYDPVGELIIDYVDGYKDIKRRVVRIIRDPRQSYIEDPVRMIRALKYQATANFGIEPDSYNPIRELGELVAGCSSARVMEEIYKILRSGASRATMAALYKSGLLRHLAPEVAEHLDRSGTRDFDQGALGCRLAALDRLTAGGRYYANPVLLAVLFADLVAETVSTNHTADPMLAGAAWLEPVSKRMNFSRLNKDQLLRILTTQHRFAGPQKRQKGTLLGLCRRDYFREALDFFEIGCLASGISTDDVAFWRELAAGLPTAPPRRGGVRVHRKGERPTAGPAAKTAPAPAVCQPDETRPADGPAKKKRRRGGRRGGRGRTNTATGPQAGT